MNIKSSSDELLDFTCASEPLVPSNRHVRIPLNCTRMAAVAFVLFLAVILSGCGGGVTPLGAGFVDLSEIDITLGMTPETQGVANRINQSINDFNETARQKKLGLDDETQAEVKKMNRGIENVNETIKETGVLGEEGIEEIRKLVDILGEGLDVGLDTATLEAVDEAAKVIDGQPDKWGQQAQVLVSMLTTLGTEMSSNLATEIESARTQLVADTNGLIQELGQEGKCMIDFTGQRADLTISQAGGKFMAGLLPFTAKYYEKYKSLPPTIPRVCTIGPNFLELVWVDGKLRPGAGSKLVTVSGFNFTDNNLPTVTLRSDDEKTTYPVPLFAKFDTPYKLTVNLTGNEFKDVVNPVGLTLEWPEIPEILPAFRFHKAVVIESAPVAIANFRAINTRGSAPLEVSFKDDSSGQPKSWQWNFGDGSVSNLREPPVHPYDNPGVYTVTLTVDNSFSAPNTLTRSNFITVTVPPAPLPDFTINGQREGIAPLKVTFIDLSGDDVERREWSFGDGSTSTAKDPEHYFSEPGSYPVRLTVYNKYDAWATKEVADYIVVHLPLVTPDFDTTDAEPTGQAPFTVNFRDKSSGNPTMWRWDFGDGVTSEQQSPSHTYAFPGTFTVRLTAYNQDGAPSIAEKAAYVSTSSKPPLTPVARNVRIAGSITLVDDEGTFGGDDEVRTVSYDRSFTLSPAHLEDSDFQSWCVGGEVRGELSLRVILQPNENDGNDENDGSIQVIADAKYYEGTSCDTDDFERNGQSITSVAVGRMAPVGFELKDSDGRVTVDLRVTNSELDSALYPLNIRNVGSGGFVAVVCRRMGMRPDCTAEHAIVEQSRSSAFARWKIRRLDETNGVVEIIHAASEKCLDVAEGSVADEAGIYQSTCNGADSQRWLLHDPGDGGGIVIVNSKSGKCLEVANASTADHAKVQQVKCHGANHQRWNLYYLWP